MDMYKAKGQNARAEAHRVFLKPARNPQSETSEGNLSGKQPSPMTTPMLPPTSAPQAKQRRPTFNFSSHFKRTEKPDSPPAPIPIRRNSNSHFSPPFLVADEIHHLSTSPHDTSSLYTGPDNGLTDRQLRTQSINSIGSPNQLQRWTTGSDVASQSPAHQRTASSLSKPPTIYQSLSPTDLEQRFREVSNLCSEGKSSKAVERGTTLLALYDPESRILVHRQEELKDNIKKGKSKGLAGTGHRFSPLHFFSSMKYEATTEIDILLRLGADPNAVAYKAGYGKVDPFTPLSLAIERAHETVVRMLCDAGASWDPEAMRIGARVNPDRDGTHPLLQAVQKGNTNIVRTLLEHHFEMTEEMFPRLSWHGNCLLHEACFRCDIEMVELLLNFARHTGSLDGTSHNYSFVGNPLQQDAFGMTAVMYAVDMRDYNEKLRAYKLRNRIACLKLLLDLNTNNIETDIPQSDIKIETQDEISSERPPQNTSNGPSKFGTSLHLQDKRGNTVYWYVDESRAEDTELVAFLNEQSRRSRLIEL